MTAMPTHQAARALKIALVTETYPPEVNGVAATLARVVQGLRERGHHLQLVRPRQSPTDQPEPPSERWQETLVRGLPVPRYPELRMGLPATRQLTRLWQAQRPDVVHLVTEGPLGWSGLRAARRLGLPVVSDFRTNFHAYTRHYGVGWLGRPMEAWLRHFHNRTDRTMVPTRRLAQELEARGFERLSVIARGVDAQRFNPVHRDNTLRHLWGAEDTTHVALCVGRLAPEKNLDMVIDAWRSLQRRHPDTRLVLVGDGPDRARLRQRCPEAVFAGTLRGDDLAKAYASADIFLFASMTETFGNVVAEAMASGLAVLAFDHAAAGELIQHGHNGLIAPLGQTEAFLNIASHLLDNHDRLRHMGRYARVTAQSLDWQRIVAGVENEYHATLSSRVAAPADVSSLIQAH
ncbi:glycoside hydrolase [Hydrogenophaga crassostreae]|uniref:Glycoside hydrolase n=2 Tax=Hydrogenophaga crassostreae TaxID=1763535 RepID=A0A162YX78_9BURK|nr:glycoside hydrolase [Hydrogenophaga crassostreae]OAD40957.1 glycoside hydrolase [Hydrogenophaga crassostreae]